MKQLMYSDIYSWSIFSEMRQVDFNGHLWVRPEGNILIDPVPMIDSDLNQLTALGGAKLIVITNCDHERQAEEFRKLTGAQIAVHEADQGALSTKVNRSLADQEEIVPGLTAIHLRYGKSDGEIALYFSEREIVLAGDLIVGAPMGNLSLLADDKLANPAKAALEIRKLLALSFDTILVGDGHSILQDGRRQLVECLERRKDIYINRINVNEIAWKKREVPPPYDFMDKDIDPLIGARNLGYRLIRLEPGNASYPMHLHNFGEEMFYVMEGKCTLKTPRGNLTVTQEEFIAFPPGQAGTHKFVNDGQVSCTLLAVGIQLPHDVSEYPDSDKIFPYVAGRIFRKSDDLSYWDGEV